MPVLERFYRAITHYLANVMKPLSEQVGRLFTEVLTGPFKNIAESVKSLNIPSSLLPNVLFESGVNTPQIHTPTYEISAFVEPIMAETDRRRNLDAYDALLTLEQELRELIRTELRKLSGQRWWKQRVPSEIRLGCESRKQKREQDTFAARRHPIEYAYVDDYRSIIVRTDNWDDVFSRVFGRKIEVEPCFLWANQGRVDIGHSRMLSDDTYTAFMFAV